MFPENRRLMISLALIKQRSQLVGELQSLALSILALFWQLVPCGDKCRPQCRDCLVSSRVTWRRSQLGNRCLSRFNHGGKGLTKTLGGSGSTTVEVGQNIACFCGIVTACSGHISGQLAGIFEEPGLLPALLTRKPIGPPPQQLSCPNFGSERIGIKGVPGPQLQHSLAELFSKTGIIRCCWCG
jgi:hypothetical protein